MSESKKIMVDFLKGKGATNEEVAAFEKVFDGEFSGLMKSDAEIAAEKRDAAEEANRIDVGKLAAEASIRN